uniref:Uncharacterized protein n=1 Tax=Kalanchoe fedtschenkoi TaxID=63787 RepID=A0A7N0VAH1_KALFE
MEVLTKKQKIATDNGKKCKIEDAFKSLYKDNSATYVHLSRGTTNTYVVASIANAKSPEWIVEIGTSRHVTSNASTANCARLVTLSNVSNASPFLVNFLSISAIILYLKCVISFYILKVIFQEKKTGRRLRTGTWRNGLWYLDREGMNSAFISLINKGGVGGTERRAEEVLMVHHSRMGNPSFVVGQAVLISAQLINKMSSKILEKKSSCEMLSGDNSGIIQLKVFGCISIEKKLFVSRDVHFWEFELYYTEGVTSPFDDSLDT